jgi:hypothetical protein
MLHIKLLTQTFQKCMYALSLGPDASNEKYSTTKACEGRAYFSRVDARVLISKMRC